MAEPLGKDNAMPGADPHPDLPLSRWRHTNKPILPGFRRWDLPSQSFPAVSVSRTSLRLHALSPPHPDSGTRPPVDTERGIGLASNEARLRTRAGPGQAYPSPGRVSRFDSA